VSLLTQSIADRLITLGKITYKFVESSGRGRAPPQRGEVNVQANVGLHMKRDVVSHFRDADVRH